MSFVRQSAEQKAKSTESDDDDLTKETVPKEAGRTNKLQSSDLDLTSSVAKKGPKSDDSDLGLSRAKRQSEGADQLSEYEHTCCMMHLNSDCFLTKVVHHCADSSQLRTVRLLQTMFNFVVRDVLDLACGRIETLEQCKKYTESADSDDLGF